MITSQNVNKIQIRILTITEKTETFEIFEGVGDLSELVMCPPELLF